MCEPIIIGKITYKFINWFQLMINYETQPISHHYSVIISLYRAHIIQYFQRISFLLAHLSQRLKWAIVIAHRPSVRRRPSVCPSSVCLSVNFYIFNFFSRTARWILMKLGRDEVLMVPYKCCCFSARSAQGRIQGGAKIGHGGPLLQETSSSDRKATATNQMDSNDLEACGKKCCYFWFHSEVKFLMRFWRLFGFSHFYAPGLKGPPGASSVWIVRPSVRLSVRLSVCPSVIPSHLYTKCNI